MKRIATLLSLLVVLSTSLRGQVTLVDVIPASMTNEDFSNCEPFITFNPADPLTLVLTAFVRTDANSVNGPLFVSFDGGLTWSRRDIIPMCDYGCPYPSPNSNDITVGYNASGRLFAGMINANDEGTHILTTNDPTLTTPMTSLSVSTTRDQPYITSATVFGWFDPGVERVYVGNNAAYVGSVPGDIGTFVAAVDQSLDAAAASAGVTTEVLDTRMPRELGSKPQVRPVVHPDGTLYVAYIRRTAPPPSLGADIIVVRDDAWAKTAPRYSSLAGPDGVTVASVEITNDYSGAFGGERINGDLAIAVDPWSSDRVYLSYAARTSEQDVMALHLLRSINRGDTWTQLLMVPNAKNGSIAVNSRGHIAFLYQQLVGITGSRHWQTHLQRSVDGAAWSELVLSDFPGEDPGAPHHEENSALYIADYDRVINVGKNFYGTFAASNDPTTFPNGISYLRNRSEGGALLKDDGTSVRTSIDPIFFRTTEMAADVDVYVRDWTDLPALRDRGLEPSSRNDFFHTSDVWNRRSNDPQQPDPATDRPQHEDPWPASMGRNWAFTRVSREATGSPQEVKIEFLYSDGGVGTNYVGAGETLLTLPAGADRSTLAAGAGLRWDLPSGASNHVCLATQIHTADDPYRGETLAGRAPGWPYLDLEFLNDNNKAQRNMQVFGFTDSSQGGTSGSAGAVIHNGSIVTRDMHIGIEHDLGDIAALLLPKVRFIGGKDQPSEPTDFKSRTTFTLPRMRPGENRWVDITVDNLGKDTKGDSVVKLYEVERGRTLNGYAFVFRPTALDDVIRQNTLQDAAIFSRLAALGQTSASSVARQTQALLKQKTISLGEYGKLVKTSLGSLRNGIRLSRRAVDDPFGIPKAIEALTRTAEIERLATQHLSLLNRIDAVLTMSQKARGDAADAVQMMRWQRELLSHGRFAKASTTLAAMSGHFIDGFAKRELTLADYSRSIREMLPGLKVLSASAADAELARRYEALAKANGIEAIERAHRDLLLRMEEIEP